MNFKIAFFCLLVSSVSIAQNVIIVVIDGSRYTETFGGGATYIPHMYNDMRPSSTLYSNFRIADEGNTITNPGHASIACGTWQQIDNAGFYRPTTPTIFEYFRKQLESTVTENYLIAGKEKLNVISYSEDPDYGELYGATEICFPIIDGDHEVYDTLINVMSNFHPRLILVNFPKTDIAGHSNEWESYLESLTKADSLIYELWLHILAGDYGYTTANTTLFITNDHGRHDDENGGFLEHGDDCEGCEHIMLLAMGRNVLQGIVNNDLHYQIEIAATVGDLLNFNTPLTVGESLFNGTNPLPVELASFNVFQTDNGANLIWETKTEVSNSGFEIQRRKNVDSQLESWNVLGFVEGHANSNSPKVYSFLDIIANSGYYSYRLKMINIDGSFEYSNVIDLDIRSLNEFSLEQNYPNPFNPVTKIKFTIPSVETGHAPSLHATLKIFDVLGNEIVVLVNEQKSPGSYEVEFDVSSLKNISSGIYFSRLQAGNFSRTKKMVYLK